MVYRREILTRNQMSFDSMPAAFFADDFYFFFRLSSLSG